MNSNPPALLQDSRAVLSTHARSFRWAGALLPRHQLDDAAVLYAFCRQVDDLVDEADSAVDAVGALDALDAELRDRASPRPLIAHTRAVLDRGPIGIEPALQLLHGVRGDLGTVRFADDAELLRYSYRVAGTVGLMMCAVLGVYDPAASPFAVDLGVAMQITNICRDVHEDAVRGRVYLPARRLEDVGLSSERLLQAAGPGPSLNHAEREALSRVVRDLLALADTYYASANQGMRYIPLRARLAIHVASRVYRGIGTALRQRDCDPWQHRAFTSTPAKVVLSLLGLLDLARYLLAPLPHHRSELHLELRDLPGCGA
ncbi:MAG: phytoene/squalene synthase family protein [Deltaproteobacteria bacterium]|nr:MAG: phytoene/squalene synthase family protein [Deltaproteobacteria bacterium]